jgi:hypothetical protein
MKVSWFSLYQLVLALWVGGIAIFTFLVTPIIFKSYGRDTAGGIVGKLLPPYFWYNLILAALALIVFFLVAADRSETGPRLSLVLLSAALIINVFIVVKLHPEAVKVKQEVTSFERESPDSTARKKFARLHGVSAALNLFLLVDGLILLVAGPLFKK